MSSNPSPESLASGNTADPGVAPRQVVQRADGTDVELVTFPPGDPENPRNWPTWRKWSIVIVIMFIDLTVSFAASGFSPAAKKFAKDFGVSSEVGTLGLSLCVLGFALGPMTLAPLSEYEFAIFCSQMTRYRDLTRHISEQILWTISYLHRFLRYFPLLCARYRPRSQSGWVSNPTVPYWMVLCCDDSQLRRNDCGSF